jgi:hypothetical protein
MRKLLTWLVVTIGIAALVRRLRRRRQPQPESQPGSQPESIVDTTVAAAQDTDGPSPSESRDPADELRRKLASARDEAGLSDAPAKLEPAEAEENVDARRANVHEQGKAAIDEMQRSTEE